MIPGNLTLAQPFGPATRTRSPNQSYSSANGALAQALLLVALIGWFDYVTGDLTITLFYFGPVALAAWRVGRRGGWVTAFLSATSWLVSDFAVHQGDRMLALPYANAVMLLLVCGVVAELVLSTRRAHDRLRARLELRTVSLAEVHHRIKNNLQIVSSLLLLHSDKFQDPEVRRVFVECRERINAMARLHEQLYVDAERSKIDFAPHLRELAEILVRAHRPSGCKLRLDLRADRIPLDLDQGILLSLIATEMLVNPLKHAFNERAEGRLEVELHWSGRHVVLSVRDNGAGLPRELSANNPSGSGLDLVRAMCRQLGGVVTVDARAAGGTNAMISFPIKSSPNYWRGNPALISATNHV